MFCFPVKNGSLLNCMFIQKYIVYTHTLTQTLIYNYNKDTEAMKTYHINTCLDVALHATDKNKGKTDKWRLN